MQGTATPKVKVQIKPQKAPPEQPLQKLKMKQVNNIAIADVDVDLPGMGDSFSVSAGLGGMGGGSLLGGARGGLGMGMPNQCLRPENPCRAYSFVIDANRRMVADKGGLNSYQVIKDEITDMVGNLSAGTLSMWLAGRTLGQLFKPQLVLQGRAYTELVEWIGKVNTDAAYPGLEGMGGLKPA